MDKNEALKPVRIEAFWGRVDKSAGGDACWPWTGPATKSTGYGQCVVIVGLPASPPGGVTTAHRQAWIITNGDPGTHESKKGNVITNRILHRCPGGANRLCCNPSHLEVGTDKDNADDRASEGHTFRGEQVTIHKLTEANVREALLAHAQGESISSLARRYGVHRGTMTPAMHGETWAHVAPEIPRRPRRQPNRRN